MMIPAMRVSMVICGVYLLLISGDESANDDSGNESEHGVMWSVF